MEYKIPLVRSVSFLVVGAFGLAFGLYLFASFGLVAGLLLVMGCVAVAQGILGIRHRESRPIVIANGKLSFWRRSNQIVVETDSVARIWYNTKGIDKRVTIALRSGQEIDIPAVYGLASLARKLNKHLQLA